MKTDSNRSNPTQPPNWLAMLNQKKKKKLELPLKTRKNVVFPERLGSLIIGFESKNDAILGSNSEFESGEELETFQPYAFGFEREVAGDNNEVYNSGDGESELRIKHRNEKDGQNQVSVAKLIAADEKRSDLEFELSQKEINLEKLQRIASTGLPDGGSWRATTWKLLLGYLPPSRDLWERELTENRLKYKKLKEELLSTPTEVTRTKDKSSSSSELETSSGIDGQLERHEISQEDHPLSLGKASAWHQYYRDTDISDQIDRDLHRTHPDLKFFSAETPSSKKNREAMKYILLLFAKLNPAIRYVQGMNEAHAEADSFSCFVRLLSDSVDHFCQQLDNSSNGIHSTLPANDEELWRHLEFTTKVNPQFYAFRWITLLLTQEFNFNSIMRIRDSLLSNPFGVQDIYASAGMLCNAAVREKLLSGDFAANLKLLQHYPDINIEYLLQVARDLTSDVFNYRLSL
ncbi:LOW QUALITY PROTEIN: Rab-GTPase-TBC domain [Dillenia turbinata]|uniref:Rab-GTPase-TBC domain n=1 Tax=Dillenia turbinata TaxID=194707 RepID=A0AAN8ZLA8_9MAGN